MKNKLLLTLILTMFCLMVSKSYAGQEFTFDPSQIIPSDTGFYYGGAWIDENDDGVLEPYDGCYDAYGDRHHFERGNYEGFTFFDVMVMPTCWPKNIDRDFDGAIDAGLSTIVKQGYAELTKSDTLILTGVAVENFHPDSVSFGHIVSPPLLNLDSIHLEVSNDISCNDARRVNFYIDYSTDNGQNWSSTYIMDEACDNKEGVIKYYNSQNSFEFKEMADASKISPVLLRLSSGLQRVKVFRWIITAETGVGIKDINKNIDFIINENTLISNKDQIIVYNIMGQFIEKGKEITLEPGIYIVKDKNGYTQKVIIK